jgi:hypothetical protein
MVVCYCPKSSPYDLRMRRNLAPRSSRINRPTNESSPYFFTPPLAAIFIPIPGQYTANSNPSLLMSKVIGKVTQIFHRSSAAVLQVAAARAHSFRVRAQRMRRFSGSTCPFQGEFKDSPLTQLRGKQGASFAWFLVRF